MRLSVTQIHSFYGTTGPDGFTYSDDDYLYGRGHGPLKSGVLPDPNHQRDPIKRQRAIELRAASDKRRERFSNLIPASILNRTEVILHKFRDSRNGKLYMKAWMRKLVPLTLADGLFFTCLALPLIISATAALWFLATH